MQRAGREPPLLGDLVAPRDEGHPVRIRERARRHGEEHVVALGEFEARSFGDLAGEDPVLPHRLLVRIVERVVDALGEHGRVRLAGVVGEGEERATGRPEAAQQATVPLPDACVSGVRRARVRHQMLGDGSQDRGRQVALDRSMELTSVRSATVTPVLALGRPHDPVPLRERMQHRAERRGRVRPRGLLVAEPGLDSRRLVLRHRPQLVVRRHDAAGRAPHPGGMEDPRICLEPTGHDRVHVGSEIGIQSFSDPTADPDVVFPAHVLSPSSRRS